MNKQIRNELFLIAGVAVVSLLLFFGGKWMSNKQAAVVEVSVNGAVTDTYPIDQDADFVVTSTGGKINRISIHDGKVSITEASCPDKLCIHQGTITESGQSLICLPNRVIVTIQ